MWKKLGQILHVDNWSETFVSHACVPTPIRINSTTVRVYFAPRNSSGKSIPTFVDLNASDLTEVIYEHRQPILDLGELGTFDDDGIMPCSVVRKSESELYLYYVGWNPCKSVPYRNAIGLAISNDNGNTFYKPFPGALVERNRTEPYFTASPFVFKDGDLWHLYYASSTGFIVVNEQPEPLYEIKYAHSTNGIDWVRTNHTCIKPAYYGECTARPTVIRDQGIYKMWYTFRGSFDYRDGTDAYKIGYAESIDGKNWVRMDDQAGIELSESGDDSLMQTYPAVITIGEQLFLFYNGNGFGKTGIFLAQWEN
jgi:hypothetical protein